VKINHLIVLLIIPFLTACSNMNGGFDCPNKAGVLCKSIDQIDGMVDTGAIQSHLREKTIATGSDTEMTQTAVPLEALHVPVRQAESVVRIWIAPYEDTENNYHPGHPIYSVSDGGHWTMKPLKELV
jgi:conjugal transfer pilus assembly protein TraV